MKTKLLDYILTKANEISKKNDFPCVNCHCVLQSMIQICEAVYDDLPNDIDQIEFQELTLAVSKYKKENVIPDKIVTLEDRDKNWSRQFRIWLSMSTRSSMDVFKYIKPALDSIPMEADDESTKNLSKLLHPKEKENEEERRVEDPSLESSAEENEKPVEEVEKFTINSLVDKTVKVRETLLDNLVGQNYAVKSFVDGYFEGEFSASLEQKRKGPKATFLFAGSPGVGKTFLAIEAAEALGIPSKKFDMSGYADDGSAFDLMGANSNYKSPKPGDLTGFVHDHPDCLLIFDEIEKAHPKVINLFLQILDAGFLYDNKYEENISFKDTMIIFTTNAGKQLYQDSTNYDFSGVSKKVILGALEKDVNPTNGKPFFPQAICSRLASGYVFMFNHLKANDLSMIVARELIKQQENFEKQYKIESVNCESMATTILFSLGGKCDARSVTGATKKFFASELFELFRLISNHKDMERIEWKIDFSDTEDKVKEMYHLPEDAAFLFVGDALPEDFSWKGTGNMYFADNLETAREILKDNEISFAAIDYRYGMKEDQGYLNSEDITSVGKSIFEEIKQFYSEVTVYVWEKDDYTYTKEEYISLTSRGAEDILKIDLSDTTKTEEQIDQLMVQLWQQKSLETLAAKHQVLTYETAQQISPDGKEGIIQLYNLKLSTAIDADEQNVIVSADEKPNVHWDDIVINQDAKDELQYFQQYLKNPKEYLSKGAKAPKGILMYGPPGTGKTTLAKVMATESDVTFLSASADQFISRWAGEGPQSVHRIFAVARKYAPAILFIDEIDAIGSRRGDSEDHSGKQEILNALLTEMDGFKVSKNKPVLVMAATNLGGNNGNTGALDPALVRRFDRSICIDLPDRDNRVKLLKLLRKRNPILKISDSMAESLAERSIGMSPALIEGAINAAIREAIRTGTDVTDDIIDESFEKYNSGDEKHWAPEELLKTARHEAGHAFISHIFGATPSYLTIVARDNHGGYMLNASNENKGSYTKKDLLERISVALGGRAAELVYYGETDGMTTGPSGDLQTATSIIYHMICDYGMYPEITSAMIPESHRDHIEIQTLASSVVNTQLKQAIEIIKEHKTDFDHLVDVLMAKTHMNKKELEEVLPSR